MKRITAVIVLLLSAATAFAQLEKGTQLIGANVSMSSRNNTTATQKNVYSSSYNINLRYGRFVANQLAVGLSCPLNYSRIEQQSNLSWGAGPFLRYYSPFEDSKLNLLVEVRGSYLQNKFEDKATKTSNQTSYLGGSAGAGVIYFFNESIGLETLVDYTYLSSLKNTDKSGGLTLNIGFQIYLNKYGF